MTRLTKTEGLAKRRAFAAAGIAELGGYLLCGLDDRFDDAVALQILLADLRHGDGNRGDGAARVIEERRACAVQPFFCLLVVFSVTLTADLLEFLPQGVWVGDRVLRESPERSGGDDAIGLGAVEVREQRLADGRAVKRLARADVGVHADRAAAIDLVDVDEFRVVEDAEERRLAELVDELLEMRLGGAVRFHRTQDAAADFEGAHAERVAGVVRVPADEAARAQRLQDPVDAALRKADGLTELAHADFLR